MGQPGSSWTLSEGAHTYSPSQIQYLPHVGAAFGETIPVDTAVGLSPDAAGEHGAYFVDDTAVQTLRTASIIAPATGLYSFGFDTYAPANGYSNPGNSSYFASVGSSSISGAINGLQPTTWQSQQAMVSLTAGNTYDFQFTFTGGGPGQASDIVVDRFYLIAVPEPETGALMAMGLCGVGLVLRRRRNPA